MLHMLSYTLDPADVKVPFPVRHFYWFLARVLLRVISDSAISWTVTHQGPLFMEFSKQEYWSALPFPTPRDLPNPEIKRVSLASPALAGRWGHLLVVSLT